MKIHKEGYTSLMITVVILMLINFIVYYFCAGNNNTIYIINIISVILFFMVLQFFRVPMRNQVKGDNLVIAPADGKVVVIEQTEEKEFFGDKRMMISFSCHQLMFIVTGILLQEE